MTTTLLETNMYSLREIFMTRKITDLDVGCVETKLEINLDLYQLEEE